MTTGRINQITTRHRHAFGGRPRCSRRNIVSVYVPYSDTSELTPDSDTQPPISHSSLPRLSPLSLPAIRHSNDASTQINVAKAQTDGHMESLLLTDPRANDTFQLANAQLKAQLQQPSLCLKGSRLFGTRESLANDSHNSFYPQSDILGPFAFAFQTRFPPHI